MARWMVNPCCRRNIHGRAQEIEALRAGRAALVAAREETAATRARANTAQLLANNPVLLRLREIEALAEVAGGDGNTVVLTLPRTP